MFFPDVLSANGFQSDDPFLMGPLTRDDFDVCLHKRPSGTSPGDDSISNEMWQASPEPMKDALYRAVSKDLTSGRIPQEWEGALVKLLVKRQGEEHLLESLRPMCLMATAAKITTGIWAYLLSQAAERDRVYEGAHDDDPFIVLTETKFSFRCIPVGIGTLLTGLGSTKNTCDNVLTMTSTVPW
jgi:hypothetical protein